MLGDWKTMKLIYPLLWQQFRILRKFMIQMNFPLTLKVQMMIVSPSTEPYKDPHHLNRFSQSASSLSNHPLGVSNVQQP
jgi:hypothetical protein